MIFDESDMPVHYRFLELNPVFEKQTGLKDAVGITIKQLVPDHEEHWRAAGSSVGHRSSSLPTSGNASVKAFAAMAG